MQQILAIAFAFALLHVLPATLIQSEDWITAQSYYTHNHTGERVPQFAPIGPFYTYGEGNISRSGYRHTRSSLQFGGSVDHYHSVEEWGRPIQPYDEWRFPYRPYSVPYSQWGPPYAGLGRAFGTFPYFPFPTPFPFPFAQPFVQPPVLPGQGRFLPPGLPYPGYRPWNDDRYPAFDDRATWRHDPFPIVPP